MRTRVTRRGQISLEYVLLIAFTFVILIPGTYFFYQYASSSAASLASAQYTKVGQEMLSTALTTVAQGEGSWILFDTTLPDNVVNISIEGGGTEIVVRYETGYGPNVVVFFSDVKLSANDPTDLHDGQLFVGPPRGGANQFRFEAGPGGIVGISDMSTGAGACVDTAWTPLPSSQCLGVSFTQTSNCGTTLIGTGAMNCCGDATRQGSEACDNGAASNGPCPAACSATCTNNVCGCTETTWLPLASTQCAGVSFTQTSNCGTTRTSTGTMNCCGDAVLQGSESCDLGDLTHGNGNGVCPKTCSVSCTVNLCITPVCGNDVKETGEQCDGAGSCWIVGQICGDPSTKEGCSCIRCLADGICYDSCALVEGKDDPDCAFEVKDCNNDGVCDLPTESCETCEFDCGPCPCGGAMMVTQPCCLGNVCLSEYYCDMSDEKNPVCREGAII